MKQLLIAMTFIMSFSTLAFDSYESVQNIEMQDSINVDGQYSQKRPMTASERMKIMRKKLEERNEMIVQKKIETMRLKQELEMAKKLQAIFDRQMKAIESL